MFPIALWNVNDRVSTSLPRTDSSTEGWHNAFAKRLSVAHPTMTKLIDRIRRDQSKFEIDVVQLLTRARTETEEEEVSPP